MTKPQIIDAEWEEVVSTKQKPTAKLQLQKLGGADVDAIINAVFGLMLFGIILYLTV